MWPEETPQAAVVHNIIRTLRSIRCLRQLAYVSVPITSGRKLYELKLEEGDVPDLTQRVVEHNSYAGYELVGEVARRRNCPVIYPADLVPIHQKWNQDHFQALWLSIIAEMCTELHLCNGWEFSNGCVEEFTHVMQLRLGVPRHPKLIFFNSKEAEEAARKRMKKIAVFDHRGDPMSLDQGEVAVKKAIEWLRGKSFASEKLERCVGLMRWTQQRLAEGFYQ